MKYTYSVSYYTRLIQIIENFQTFTPNFVLKSLQIQIPFVRQKSDPSLEQTNRLYLIVKDKVDCPLNCS